MGWTLGKADNAVISKFTLRPWHYIKMLGNKSWILYFKLKPLVDLLIIVSPDSIFIGAF